MATSVKTPISPAGRYRITAIRKRPKYRHLHAAAATSQPALQQCRCRLQQDGTYDPIYSVPIPPTIDTKAASTEMLKLKATFGSMK